MDLSPALQTLGTMLTYRRPAGSRAEAKFIRRYIQPLPGAWRDEHGNWHVIIGDDSPILWSCHLDTVSGPGPTRQQVVYRDAGFHLARPRRGSCLGADDTVGVWLCIQMIAANVPGHYVFHHAEELGCVGSSGLAAECPAWMDDITMAIAFDRRGRRDVITHQCGVRTCSDAFAWQLADLLNTSGLEYSPSDRGLYTDTAQYDGIVAECTNVAIGYYDNHGPSEWVDVQHVASLAERLTSTDWSQLTPVRNPLDAIDTDWRLVEAREYDVKWLLPMWADNGGNGR